MTTKKEQKEKVARYLLQGAPLRILMPTTSAETYRECMALVDYWHSIPWWKFWLKPSFEEQKSIIASKWSYDKMSQEIAPFTPKIFSTITSTEGKWE